MKKAILISGLFAILTVIAGRIAAVCAPHLTDFIGELTWISIPVFLVLALIAFRYARYVLLPVACLLLALILVPRHYGTPPLKERAGTRYWELPTGSRIAYTLLPAESAQKPYPIIYLHGGPGGAIGDNNIRILSSLTRDGYDIYLYDQVGGGLSGRLDNIREYTTDRHKRDLEEIVKKIRSEKVILLGQSWGAILAVLYLADNPAKVEKIIFTGPGPILPAHPKLATLPSPDSLQLREPYYSNRQGNEKANNIRTNVMAFWARHFGMKLASDKEADDFGGYLNMLVDRSTVYDTAKLALMTLIPGAGFYSMVMTARSFDQTRDPRPKVRNSPVPILVMKGQYDNQRWGFTHEYLDLFPNHRLVVIPAAGHAISAEQPELYLKTIRDFLRE